MKKILLIVGSMNAGGIENHIMTILRNINRCLVDIELLYITDEECFFDKEIKKLGFRIHRITPRNVSIRKHNQELKKILKENIYDIVHIHYGITTCLLDAKVAKKSGVKFVITQAHNSSGCNAFINLFFKTFFMKYVDCKLSCSSAATEWFYRKKDFNDVIIVKNSIDLERYSYNCDLRNKVRKQLNFENNDIVIGEVARFSEQKNQRYLIDIFHQLNIKKNNSFLVLIGEGHLKEEIKEKVKSFHLEDKVLFLDNTPDVNIYLNSFDFFVMPSLYEGLPVSLIEAQANGLKCIVGDTIDKKVNLTGNVEFISIEENCVEIWVDSILNSNTLRNLTAINQLKSNGYGVDNLIKTIENLYLQCEEDNC